MKTNTMPNTDLKVSALCLGTMTFGKPVAENDAVYLTHQAIAKGINFIDTANMYEGYARFVGSPGGVAEEILSKAIAGRRDEVIVATKVGMKIGPNDYDMGLSRKHVLREVDRSLARMKTDYIDLYYMHKPDPNTPLEESVKTFEDLVTNGKIRYWGVSNITADQLGAMLKLCDDNGWHRPVAIQPAYSYLKRDIEKDLLPLCQQERISVIPYQVLQGGLLTGKYHRNEPIPANSRQLEKPEWTMPLDDKMFDTLENIEKEGKALGRSLLQHALLSLLEKPMVVSLIVGIKNEAQLDNLVQAVS